MQDDLERLAAQRKFCAAARRTTRHLPTRLPPGWFLTDPERTPDPLGTISRIPAGFGVILRHFGAPEQIRLALPIAGLANRRRLVFLVAADPELAQMVGADGVHWPEAKLNEARRWRSRFPLMTASAHSRQGLARARATGMDAALLSTVFPSESPSAKAAMGALRFRNLARANQLTLYALGGITSENAAEITDFGGFAAVSSLSETFAG